MYCRYSAVFSFRTSYQSFPGTFVCFVERKSAKPMSRRMSAVSVFSSSPAPSLTPFFPSAPLFASAALRASAVFFGTPTPVIFPRDDAPLPNARGGSSGAGRGGRVVGLTGARGPRGGERERDERRRALDESGGDRWRCVSRRRVGERERDRWRGGEREREREGRRWRGSSAWGARVSKTVFKNEIKFLEIRVVEGACLARGSFRDPHRCAGAVGRRARGHGRGPDLDHGRGRGRDLVVCRAFVLARGPC